MPSFEDFRKQVPIPETCPICGKKLTPENAAVDHIIPPRLGGTDDYENLRYVCKQCNARKSDNYNALLEYYIRLMNVKGKSDEDSSLKIEYLLRNTSRKDLDAFADRVESMDPAFRRLSAYAAAIAKMHGKELELPEPTSDELAESMAKRLKAYSDYNFKDELRKEINGNIFTYKSDFPIDSYTEILASYGEEETGEVYSVYLDEEGRLVVY